MEDYIFYIIRHLIPELSSETITEVIGYTSTPADKGPHKIIFIPSGFFDEETYGTKASLPVTPLQTIEDIPLLYGTPVVEMQNGQLIIYADLIASAYFLLSRYEEYIRKDIRDIHGRFPGKQSLPYRENFLHRPVVEEYGILLRKWLRAAGIEIPEIPGRLNKVYLTHDVDVPFVYRKARNLIKSFLPSGNTGLALKSYFGEVTTDPAFTFPWLFKVNKDLAHSLKHIPCETILFFKAGGRKKEDKPVYNLHSKDIQYLFSLCKEEGISIGLHASYEAGMHPSRIKEEKTKLEKATHSEITCNRHHYLCSREPEDMTYLVSSGIQEDFTMGYADVAGFRLGTCRPVHRINPADKKVYPILLHPLTIMECTLDNPKYMGLDYEASLKYCRGLIDRTSEFRGNLVLLWHNNNISPICSGNHKYRELYEDVLKYISSHQ